MGSMKQNEVVMKSGGFRYANVALRQEWLMGLMSYRFRHTKTFSVLVETQVQVIICAL